MHAPRNRVPSFFLTPVAVAIALFGGQGDLRAQPAPDVVYSDCTSIAHYGPIGTKHAYSLGSNTCNIGDANMHWTNAGSPALAMNMYRLKDGRLMQIGLGFCKTACCAAATNNCGLSCNSVGGQWLGAGCRDVYSAGYNAAQTKLAPRSSLNMLTGTFTSFPATSGDAIFRRLQVEEADLNPTLNAGALYFVEGQYVTDDDIPARRGDNNVSYKRATITAGTYAATVVGNMVVGQPAIKAWRDHGLGVGQPDPSVVITPVVVNNEGGMQIGHKATNLGGGLWRYDYAIFNFNIASGIGGFSIPMPLGTNVTGVGFHDVDYHSGEPYDNTDWTSTLIPGSINWGSPQTYAQNVNSNAIRWGTMYNFWFVANRPPATGNATITLFKPHSPQSVTAALTVPQPCQVAGNVSMSGSPSGGDVARFIDCLTGGNTVGADCDCADLDNNHLLDSSDTEALVNLLLSN